MISRLMDEFVCLRMVQVNGVDLSVFQFDYDMTFAVFFMNADGAIYGRFGTRNTTPDEADGLVTIEALREAMEASLALHKGYPANADSLKAKIGPAPQFARAELYPKLRNFSATVDFQGRANGTCIHCHQIHQAQREMTRNANQPFPDKLLYKFPMPEATGFQLDPKKRATVLRVEPNSPAAAASLRPGDELLNAAGQPLVSVADFQWILHHMPDNGGDIPLKVRRAGKTGDLNLVLGDDWKKKGQFNWRTSTWDMRRMALGGLVLKPKRSGGGLYVHYVGWHGAHNVAKNAGVLEKDEILEFGGIKNPQTEEELIAHILNTTKKGDTVNMKVKRGGREIDMSFRTQ